MVILSPRNVQVAWTSGGTLAPAAAVAAHLATGAGLTRTRDQRNIMINIMAQIMLTCVCNYTTHCLLALT